MGKDNLLPVVFVLAGLGVLGYALLKDDNSSDELLQVPPNASYQGYTNNTGASVYINAAGQILNAIGQIIGYFTNANSNNNNNDADNNGWPDDIDEMADYVSGPRRSRSRLSAANLVGNCYCANGKVCTGTSWGCPCCDGPALRPVMLYPQNRNASKQRVLAGF